MATLTRQLRLEQLVGYSFLILLVAGALISWAPRRDKAAAAAPELPGWSWASRSDVARAQQSAALPTPAPAAASTAAPADDGPAQATPTLSMNGSFKAAYPTWQPTEAPALAQAPTNVPSPTTATAGAGAPARNFAAEAQARVDAQIPVGAQLVQQPGGAYYQKPGEQVRYYVDDAGHVVDVRLPGVDTAGANQPQLAPAQQDTPPEQKIFLDPSKPADAAYLAQAAAAAPTSSAGRSCGPRSRNTCK